MWIELNKVEEIFNALNLEENTLYKVLVKKTLSNPSHESFLFTGFKNGNYCTIYTNTSDPCDMMDYYSIKIIKKLCKIK